MAATFKNSNINKHKYALRESTIYHPKICLFDMRIILS